MPVDARLLLTAALLLAPGLAPAQEESEPPLELIEMLGEMEDVDTDLDIALKEVRSHDEETGEGSPEVKNED